MANRPDYYNMFQNQPRGPGESFYAWSPSDAYGPGRGGGGGGGGRGRAPTSPYPSNNPGGLAGMNDFKFDMPEYQQYDPFKQNETRLYGNLGEMADYGKGLMDPGSDYFKQLSNQMQQQIGGQAAAGERAAALRGAYSGLGGGEGAEVMANQADIAQGGLEAQGQAMANLTLAAPQMGAQMLQSTFQPELGLQGMGESSRRYGHGSAEGARQFGVGVGLEQQRMANERAMQEAQLKMQQQQMQLQADLQRQQMEHQFAMTQGYGGGGYGGGGYGGGLGGGGYGYGSTPRGGYGRRSMMAS